mgnify:CR=1 FL=1
MQGSREYPQADARGRVKYGLGFDANLGFPDEHRARFHH